MPDEGRDDARAGEHRNARTLACRPAGRFGDQGMMTSVEEMTRTDVTGIPSR
jgi:hypothetical protein